MVNVNLQTYYFNNYFRTLGPIFKSCTKILIEHHLFMGNITIKGAIQMSGHSLKLRFFMFERSQIKHNSFDYHNFFGIFFINCKVYMLKIWHKSLIFVHLQSIQTLKVDNLCFFKTFFLYKMCTIPFENWRGF